MKTQLRKLFAPVLNYFESGTAQYEYKRSHRQILIIVGALFLTMSLFAGYFSYFASEPGGLLPTLVFFLIGAVCEIVGLLGTDKAVANIWKSR
jgi:hypothetical protein